MKNSRTNLLRKLCAVSLAAAMLAGAGLTEAGTYIGTAVQVYAVTSSSKETLASSFEYEENDNGGITITKFIGNETNVVIPSKIDGKAVTSIGDSAFCDCKNLTEVTIPDSVTSIGNWAFVGCTGLTEVTIPDSVTSIGEWAFEGCTNLKEINVDKNNKNYSSANGVLFNKDKTTLIKYPEGKTDDKYSIPNSVTSIGNRAFDDCTNLKTVTIGNSVTSIDWYAFSGCTGLTEVTIPDSVTSIGWFAFEDTAWYDNQPDGVVYAGKVAYEYKGEMPENTKITLKDGTVGIADGAFGGCTGLTEVTIPDSVISIGERAFAGCTSLTEVTIPNSVTSIGENAFSDTAWYDNQPDGIVYAGKVAYKYKGEMPENTKITLKDGTVGISDGAFDSFGYWVGPDKIEIPNSVVSIGANTFYGWACLEEIYVDKNNKNYSSENGVLYNKDKTKLICMPGGYNKTYKTYVMPDTVIKIENSALCDFYFNNCYNIIFSKALKSIDVVIDVAGYVVIPETVTYISNDALKSVSAIYGYKNSEAQKYAEKNNITFIDMDSVKKETGKYTLSSKNNDNTFVFMAQNDNFYNFSFKSESNFEYEAVNGILNVGTSDCGTSCRCSENLKKGDIITFKFSGNTSDINIDISNIYEDVLNNQTNKYVDYRFENKTVYVRGNGYIPNNYSDWNSSFYYDLNINNVVIENGITSIGSRVFYNLRNLKSVYIPESVTQIADDAFIYKYFEPTTSYEPIPIVSEGEDKIMDYITIYGAKNSYAKTYAKEKNIPFVAVNEIKDKNSNITVTGNLSDKTKLSVKSLSYKDINVGDDTTVRAYYDISLLENGKKVQPNAPVTVKIPYIGNTNNIEVYRINNDGTNEKMLSNYSNGVINFVTDHFSKYAIVTAAGMLGDTNGDGKVNIADALMIARYDAKLTTLNDTQLSVSDVNGDSKVNIADALKIARFDAKLIDSLD